MGNQVEKISPLKELKLQLDNMAGQFKAVLPKHITPERFARVVLTAIQQTPDLIDVERRSLWNAAMRAANDGLLPDGRLGAIVVYSDRKRGTKQAQWLPMVAGIRQKVRNSGEIADWTTHVVRERDAWDYEEGDNPRIFHKPVRGDRGPIIAAYSIARYRTGEVSREWMWIEDLDKVRAVSRAQHGPWQDWTEEMYRKTVAKRHAKVLPMSSDLDDLLRRPDEPEGTQAALASTVESRRLNSIGDVLDRLSGTSESGNAAEPAPSADDVTADGEVIEHDPNAAGDDQQERRHG